MCDQSIDQSQYLMKFIDQFVAHQLIVQQNISYHNISNDKMIKTKFMFIYVWAQCYSDSQFYQNANNCMCVKFRHDTACWVLLAS